MDTQENMVVVKSGWGMLALNLFLYLAVVALVIFAATREDVTLIVGTVIFAVVLLIFNIFLSAGFFTLEPNQNAVLVLFGAYKGTVGQPGFHWGNPFLTKHKVSMRIRNFNTEKLKVNDAQGNPIEIAAVVVWRVESAACATFDVDDFIEYVETQSESAVRHLANSYPYDIKGDTDKITLRGSTDEVSDTLQQELQERMIKAGIIIDEARLSHLAYAPEIASAMLQRQQAQAIVDARATIVDGAVSMVEMALEQLSAKDVVHLDEDKKASMVSNLLVVLCSDHAAHPVVNAGSLYQ